MATTSGYQFHRQETRSPQVFNHKYVWEVNLSEAFSSLETNFTLPCPEFLEGPFAHPGWMQKFSGRYENKRLLIELPSPNHSEGLGVQSIYVWSMMDGPLVEFLQANRFHVVEAIPADRDHGSWETGGCILFVANPFVENRSLSGVASIKISLRVQGRYVTPPTLQSSRDELCQRVSSFFNCEEFSDFVMICQREEFYCHKIVLGSWSDYLKAMCLHEHTKEAKHGKVEIQDAGKDTLKVVLQFMYGIDISPQLKNEDFYFNCELFKLANRFLIAKLQEVVGQELLAKMTAETAEVLFDLGDAFNNPLLKSKASQFLGRDDQPLH